jgi:hypothetical protein
MAAPAHAAPVPLASDVEAANVAAAGTSGDPAHPGAGPAHPFSSAAGGKACPAVDMVVEHFGPVHGTETIDEEADLQLQRSHR